MARRQMQVDSEKPTDGFSNLVPAAVFVVGLVCSMLGLGYAVKTLPIGIVYAVWTGIGVATTTYGMATGSEPLAITKALLLIGPVGCIAGLRVVSEQA